jgi:hypothetical protein
MGADADGALDIGEGLHVTYVADRDPETWCEAAAAAGSADLAAAGVWGRANAPGVLPDAVGGCGAPRRGSELHHRTRAVQ